VPVLPGNNLKPKPGVAGRQIMSSRRGFTLIELLTVMAVIAILAALLLPALTAAKSRAQVTRCLSNLHQMGLGMRMYADDANGFYPESGAVIPWNQTDPQTQKPSWMQQIIPYTLNTNIYRCPVDRLSVFSYFNGARTAYVVVNDFAPVNSKQIRFSSAYVLSGDKIGEDFPQDDSDKDDYTHNCVGGPANGSPAEEWEAHNKGQNILFDDGHAKWYKGYNTNEMTFRYDSLHGWE
jgi:prepilin-type N-terminal cleavage/methylation domain-containing protein